MSITAEDKAFRNANGEYRNVSVVELTMDDPRNDHLDEGTVMIQEGECEDGISHSVRDDENKEVEVECEVLETFTSESWMTREEIKDWGVQQAKKSGDW